MQKLFEDWRKYRQQRLKEADLEGEGLKDKDFQYASDVDMPFKAWIGRQSKAAWTHRLVVFDQNDIYELTGDLNHGGVSHAIKHLHELDEQFIKRETAAAAQFIINNVDDEDVFIKSKKSRKKPISDVLTSGKEAKEELEERPGMVHNTFDFIQDKIEKGIALNAAEEGLNEFIINITGRYYKIVEEHRKGAVDITEDMSVGEIVAHLSNKDTIRFIARHQAAGPGPPAPPAGVKSYYVLNIEHGTHSPTNDEGLIKTLFPINKSGVASLSQIFCFFHSSVLRPLGVCNKQNPGEPEKKGNMTLIWDNLIKAFEEVTGISREQPAEEPEPEPKPEVALAPDTERAGEICPGSTDEIKIVFTEDSVLVNGKPIFEYISELGNTKAIAHFTSKFSRCYFRAFADVLRPGRNLYIDAFVGLIFTFIPGGAEAEVIVSTYLKKMGDRFTEYFVTTLISPAHMEVQIRMIRLLAEDVAATPQAIADVLFGHGRADPGSERFMTDLYKKIGIDSLLKSSSERDKETAEEWARRTAREQEQNENQTKTNDMHMLFENWRKYQGM